MKYILLLLLPIISFAAIEEGSIIKASDIKDAVATKIVYIAEEYPDGTKAPVCLTDAYQNRVMNTISGNGTFATILNNEVTLDPGTYLIDWSAPVNYCNGFLTLFVNVNTNEVILKGNGGYSNINLITNHSLGSGIITVAEQTSFKVAQYTQQYKTVDSVLGYRSDGSSSDYNGISINEKYFQLKIQKVND